jgi:hypothetical protein
VVIPSRGSGTGTLSFMKAVGVVAEEVNKENFFENKRNVPSFDMLKQIRK